jgi:predicted site-specific integrase-resolvase
LAEVKDDLGVVHPFCARLYGRGSARNRTQKTIEAIGQ